MGEGGRKEDISVLTSDLITLITIPHNSRTVLVMKSVLEVPLLTSQCSVSPGGSSYEAHNVSA